MQAWREAGSVPTPFSGLKDRWGSDEFGKALQCQPIFWMKARNAWHIHWCRVLSLQRFDVDDICCRMLSAGGDVDDLESYGIRFPLVFHHTLMPSGKATEELEEIANEALKHADKARPPSASLHCLIPVFRKGGCLRDAWYFVVDTVYILNSAELCCLNTSSLTKK